MPKRKTVSLNYQKTIELIHSHSWSAASFAKMIGKHSRWLSEVNRGRNLPSPEEAARMCAILQVTPGEILTEPEDVELVQSLIDQQREEQKEKPAQEGELTNIQKNAIEFIKTLSDENLEKFIHMGEIAFGTGGHEK